MLSGNVNVSCDGTLALAGGLPYVLCSMLNPRLETLQDYPFRRLEGLLAPLGPRAGRAPLDLSIGQPMHPLPPLLAETLQANAHLWGRYPPVAGTPAFREAVCAWLTRRYDLPAGALDPARHVLPVAGTKEALFLIAQAVVPERKADRRPAVLMPNPFYNVYLGGAVFAGAEPVLLSVAAEDRYLPALERLEPDLLGAHRRLLPVLAGQPPGVAADLGYLRRLIGLRARARLPADRRRVLFGDLRPHRRPARSQRPWQTAVGSTSLIVCNSLSKRSSAAGLRSGFVAGDPDVLAAFGRLRSYASAVQPLPVLAAATALWQDEDHVFVNRDLYHRKFDLADRRLAGRLGYYRPDGGFFLWLEVGDGEAAAARLWTEAAIKVLPGAYLGRPDRGGGNPGHSAIRVALVHDLATTGSALADLAACLS